MRKSLVLSTGQELADFINNQPGVVDPSALINKLIHEDIQRKGVQIDEREKAKLNDEFMQTIEQFMDEDTHAAD